MTLAEWIEAEGITRAEAGRRLNISPSYMTELCQRKRTPSTAVAVRISERSGCRVTFRDMLANGHEERADG